jgi:hypothetical protein
MQSGKDSIFEVPSTPEEYIFSPLRVHEGSLGLKKVGGGILCFNWNVQTVKKYEIYS